MKPRYGTMKIGEIMALPVSEVTAPDAMLVMWATWMHLPLAFKVMDAWGFDYATGMPWLKVTKGSMVPERTQGSIGSRMYSPPPIEPIFGPGVWFQHCTELILIGRRGHPFGDQGNPRPARKGIIIAPRGAHSEKPGELQDWIDAKFPGPKLEMFARKRRAGWICWGNELEGE
jgi:N6-adenosine-specific RNA methylase IME4